MTKIRSVFLCAVALLMTLILTPPASAAGPSRNGKCEAGEICFFYNSDRGGAVSDMSYSLANYGTSLDSCNHFIGGGNGNNHCIKNETASAWNRTSSTVRVYDGSDFAGGYQDLASGEIVNLRPGIKNNNASHKLLPPPPNPWRCKTISFEATSSVLKLFHLYPNVRWCYDGKTVGQWQYDCDGDFVPEGFWFFQDCASSTVVGYELDGHNPGGVHFQLVGKWRSGYLLTKTIKVDVWGHYDGSCDKKTPDTWPQPC